MEFRFWFWRGDKIIIRGRAPVRRLVLAGDTASLPLARARLSANRIALRKENARFGLYPLLFATRHASESIRRQNFGEGWAKWGRRIGRHQRSSWRSVLSGRPRRDARTRQPPRQLE